MAFKNTSLKAIFLLICIFCSKVLNTVSVIEEDFTLGNFLFVVYLQEQITKPSLYSHSDLLKLQKDWHDLFNLIPSHSNELIFLNKFFDSKTNHYEIDNNILSYITELPDVYMLLQNDNYEYIAGLEIVQSIILKIYEIILCILENEYRKLLYYFNYFILVSNDDQLVFNSAYSIREILELHREVTYSKAGKPFLSILRNKLFKIKNPKSLFTTNTDVVHNTIALFYDASESLALFIDDFKKKEFLWTKVLNDEVKELSTQSTVNSTFTKNMENISRSTLIGTLYRLLRKVADYSVFDIDAQSFDLESGVKIKKSVKALYFFRDKLIKNFLELVVENKKSFKVNLILLIINKLTKRIVVAPEREKLFSLIRKIKESDAVDLCWNILEIFQGNNEAIEIIIETSINNR